MNLSKHIVIIYAITCVMSFAVSYKENNNSTDIIQIDTKAKSKYKDVIARQEIISLSNNSNAYVEKLENMQVYDDYYMLHDSKDILYLFSKTGSLISNSKKVLGKGSGEYYLCLSYSYNKYSKLIEVVVPGGIMFYDVGFRFVKKIRYEDKELNSKMFDYIYDIDADTHLLLSHLEIDEEKPHYYIFNSQEGKVVSSIEYPKGFANITMQRQCISNGNFIAFPCFSYTFYTFDANKYRYRQFVSLGFKDNALREKDCNDFKSEDELNSYLLECTKSLPLRTFRSGDNIAVLIKEGPMRKDFKTVFINLNTKQYKSLSFDNDGIKFPIMDYFANNIVYACVDSEELKNYVDEALLDENSKLIYNNIAGSPNYYVLKLYLK